MADWLTVMQFHLTVMSRTSVGGNYGDINRHLKRASHLQKRFLQHLGIKPGEQIALEKMPGGELRLKAIRPTGNIKGFIGRVSGSSHKPLTLEEMHEIAASTWAGER